MRCSAPTGDCSTTMSPAIARGGADMQPPRTVPELLALRARLAPDTAGIVTPAGSSFTYREWDARSRELAAGLRRQGVRPGDRVGVFVTERAIAEYAALYTALAHLGAYAAVGMSHWTSQDAARNFSNVKVVGVITGDGTQ